MTTRDRWTECARRGPRPAGLRLDAAKRSMRWHVGIEHRDAGGRVLRPAARSIRTPNVDERVGEPVQRADELRSQDRRPRTMSKPASAPSAGPLTWQISAYSWRQNELLFSPATFTNLISIRRSATGSRTS